MTYSDRATQRCMTQGGEDRVAWPVRVRLGAWLDRKLGSAIGNSAQRGRTYVALRCCAARAQALDVSTV